MLLSLSLPSAGFQLTGWGHGKDAVPSGQGGLCLEGGGRSPYQSSQLGDHCAPVIWAPWWLGSVELLLGLCLGSQVVWQRW